MKKSVLQEINGKWLPVEVEMTAEEVTELETLQAEQPQPQNETAALKEMITAMSTATTIAQMRSAAKAFLDKTE